MTRESSNFQKFHCVLFKGLGIDTELGFIVVLWFLSTWSWRTAACDFVMWFVICDFMICDVILWGDLWFCDLPTWSWRTAACLLLQEGTFSSSLQRSKILWEKSWADILQGSWSWGKLTNIVDERGIISNSQIVRQQRWSETSGQRHFPPWIPMLIFSLFPLKSPPPCSFCPPFPTISTACCSEEKEVWQLSRQFQLHQRLSFHPPTISMPSISSTTISLSYIYSIWDVNYCSYKYIVPKKVVFTLTPV